MVSNNKLVTIWWIQEKLGVLSLESVSITALRSWEFEGQGQKLKPDIRSKGYLVWMFCYTLPIIQVSFCLSVFVYPLFFFCMSFSQHVIFSMCQYDCLSAHKVDLCIYIKHQYTVQSSYLVWNFLASSNVIHVDQPNLDLFIAKWHSMGARFTQTYSVFY